MLLYNLHGITTPDKLSYNPILIKVFQSIKERFKKYKEKFKQWKHKKSKSKKITLNSNSTNKKKIHKHKNKKILSQTSKIEN